MLISSNSKFENYILFLYFLKKDILADSPLLKVGWKLDFVHSGLAQVVLRGKVARTFGLY